MSPNFVDFMVRSSGSGFWGGNLPTDPKVSSSVGGDPPPTIELVNSGGGGSILACLAGWSGFQVQWIPLFMILVE